MSWTGEQLPLRPAHGALGKLRRIAETILGQSPLVAAINLLVVASTLALGWAALNWAVISATMPWTDSAACDGTGACWPFLREKIPLILFGTFPYAERWRPALVSLILIAMSVVTLFRLLGWQWQAGGWLSAVILFGILMGGGRFGLPLVPSAQWNGLPVLLFLGTASLACALPVGLLLAVGRGSIRPWISYPALIVIETLRGIPMVAVLFFGVFVLPLLLGGWTISPVHAALMVLIVFHGAYVAEDIRSGFQSVHKGQWEASLALGFSHLQTLQMVILPQAVKAATPALTNTAIGGFKDTSLIVLVGLHDLLSTARMAFSDPQWQKQALEAYVFVGLIFFFVSWAISRAGRRLERLQETG